MVVQNLSENLGDIAGVYHDCNLMLVPGFDSAA